ncbi:TMV resistance protein N [Morella rubra]|uniref:TMV resistance protein N n=1 Tax=Morella rubra TaxID=262757 RepID=A0A6A1UMR1_9ROSI|nr:TMV resistance protein N [Morella rubra]
MSSREERRFHPHFSKRLKGRGFRSSYSQENYADSRWCLVELTKILECKKNRQQTILPVFYHVDPSDVRNQRNSFGEAFAKLKDRFMDDKKKVEGWEAALKDVADLSGYRLSDGYF